MGVLVELRSQFRKLQWYAEVNKRGFVKILKKFDKKIGTHTQMKYLTSKISILPFANGVLIDDKLADVNKYLSVISPLVSSSRDDDGNSVKTDHRNDSDLFLEVSSINGVGAGGNTSDSGFVGEMKLAIATDDVENLESVLSEGPVSQKVLLSLLFKAVSAKATKSIKLLLTHIETLEELAELNGRNVIHRIIINHGRRRNNAKTTTSSPATPESNVGEAGASGSVSPSTNPNKANTETSSSSSVIDDSSTGHHSMNFLHPAVVPRAATNMMKVFGSDGEHAADDETVLDFLLGCLDNKQRSAIIARDHHNRTPLHYAAHYGLKLMTTVLLKYMKDWGYLSSSGITESEWKDSEGILPIQLSVAADHPKTTKVLLEAIEPTDSNKKQLAADLLPVASQLGAKKLLEVLLDYGLDINFTSESLNNETPLFICSKMNHVEAVQLLIDRHADTEISEGTYGWTPVFVAAVDGFREIVKILLSGGSRIDIVDGSGWNAMEHACLRGHLDLVDILKPPFPFKSVLETSNSNGSDSDVSTPNPATAPGRSNLAPEPHQPSTIDPIKTFGHRYLKDKSMVLVTIGTTDLRKMINPVQLDRVPYSKAHSTQLDTALSMIVSASGCIGEPAVIDLPIPDYGLSTEPLSFYSNDVEKVRLYFDLVPTYSGNQKRVLGRGVALLSSVYTPLGLKKRSLHQTVTIPIIESETLEVLGTVDFNFLVITPFHHPKMGIEKSATYWKSLITTRVIGHRGLGKNSNNKKSLQLGENTIESFIQAANLGASYVEFDVQLTKDHIPVIYHDFLVGETGIDIPMHSLTLDQFLDAARPTVAPTTVSPVGGGPARMPSPDSRPFRQRSQSVFVTGSGEREDEFDIMSDRMKHTRDFKIKGFKGNSRGHSIQSPFTTLVEAFKTLPKHVGFNIECKYPMLDESEAEDMENFAFELNLWCDTVLKCVYDYGDGRDIIFSSFHPDICLMLSLKQPSIPILFLTESGTAPMADIRASSLQEAIRFAKRWNLLGIVSECTPLIKCPRLVNVVKASGLVCVSYGTENNNPVNARLQMKSGVDAVIVDSVLAVRQGLTVGDTVDDEDSLIATPAALSSVSE
ncbi:Gde1p [Sugiyamaella lignohabitans]|uniref:Gde1p n=1 Tax=Sugiyamaella lignohabitans TaxID=796027 RepID=A0A161HGY6_9ASCO|nr:Gde1p [Sugiyamaella lignohabitans]ANB15100.1 Gde1p [Sugiyamaella lignohabitans]